MLLKRIFNLAVPASVAVIAFLHAHAIGSLMDARLGLSCSAGMPVSVAPFAEARAADGSQTKSAEAFLAHNPFDHTAKAIALDTGDDDSRSNNILDAPPCDGMRAVAAVRAEDAGSSFAALRVTSSPSSGGSPANGSGGRSVLQKTGGAVGDMHVAFVAVDRVWLEHDGKLCVAPVFNAPVTSPPPQASPSSGSALERDITQRITKTGPGEFQIDRGAVDRILEAQAELMKTPIVPDKEGGRVVGFRLVRVRPGTVLAALGLESGDRLVSINNVEVTSTERMIEAYARLRTGTLDRLTINVVRNGRSMNLDYVVR